MRYRSFRALALLPFSLCAFALSPCFCASVAPSSSTAGIERYHGKLYADGPAEPRKFALTYDDGPGYITTDLLELLEKYGAKATFFMTGDSIRVT